MFTLDIQCIFDDIDQNLNANRIQPVEIPAVP